MADTGQKSGPIGQAFIGCRFCDAASGETFANINLASGEVLANVAACDVEDVNRTVKAARRAFDAGSWSRVAPAERKSYAGIWVMV